MSSSHFKYLFRIVSLTKKPFLRTEETSKLARERIQECAVQSWLMKEYHFLMECHSSMTHCSDRTSKFFLTYRDGIQFRDGFPAGLSLPSHFVEYMKLPKVSLSVQICIQIIIPEEKLWYALALLIQNGHPVILQCIGKWLQIDEFASLMNQKSIEWPLHLKNHLVHRRRYSYSGIYCRHQQISANLRHSSKRRTAFILLVDQIICEVGLPGALRQYTST